jgi:ubiquinone/menaquinone biosynthesis C-methylase UbiE
MSRGYTEKSGKEFGKIAKEYDKGRSRENVELWAAETRRLAGLSEASIILDLGSGTGLYTVGLLEETGATTCGFDPVPRMVGQARNKSHGVHWFNAIGEWIPLRSGVLDCVFSSQVWHHIEDKQGTADECGRVLRAGGHVVIRTISHEQLHEKVVFRYFPEIKANQLRVYPSNDEFSRYFREAGFRETVFHAYSLERYQPVEEFVEIAEKRLWSMFRPISEEGLMRGVEALRRYGEESGGEPVRNDELITLVVASK